MSIESLNNFALKAETGAVDFEVSSVIVSKECVYKPTDTTSLYTIIWIRKGCVVYSIDFRQFECKGASILFLTPGQVFSVVSGTVDEGYKITFGSDFHCIEKQRKEISCNGLLFNNVYSQPMVQIKDDSIQSQLELLLESIVGELKSPGLAMREYVKSYFKLFLIEVTRLKVQQTDLTEEDPEKDEATSFSRLVEKHFLEMHQVAQYAELIGVSSKTLTKKIKLKYGKTPGEIIRNRLMLQAKRELAFTQKSIKEIAYGLGYDDPAYFNRIVKKEFDQTPQQFRNSYKL